jgi:hypothetical protein
LPSFGICDTSLDPLALDILARTQARPPVALRPSTVLILVVWPCRRWCSPNGAQGITLLGSLLRWCILVIHMTGKGVGGKIARSRGGFFFVWALLALGVTALFSVILSAGGLWTLKWGQPR